MITIKADLLCSTNDWESSLTNYLHFLDKAGSHSEIIVFNTHYNNATKDIVKWVKENKLDHLIFVDAIPRNTIVLELTLDQLLASDQLDKWLILAQYLNRTPSIKGINIPILHTYRSIGCSPFHMDFVYRAEPRLYNTNSASNLYGVLIPNCEGSYTDYFDHLKSCPFIVDTTLESLLLEDYEPYTHNLVRYLGNVLVTA